jgi:hypothetical protein
MNKSFAEEIGIKGHLTVHKVVEGQEELIYDEDYVIVSGFGWALAHLYGKEGSDRVTDFQIDRFKLGVSGGDELQVTSTTDLSSPLAYLSSYVGDPADSSLEVVSGYKWANNIATTTGEWFAKIPFSKVTRIDDRTVRYTMLVDEDSCNDLANDAKLNEIGLFISNPKASATETSVLAAYRYFSPIRKTSDFAIVFRWTISFG